MFAFLVRKMMSWQTEEGNARPSMKLSESEITKWTKRTFIQTNAISDQLFIINPNF
jgi:hypothetical protein